MTEREKGRAFSSIYFDPGPPEKTSKTAIFRMGKLVESFFDGSYTSSGERRSFASELQRGFSSKLGYEFNTLRDWNYFLKSLPWNRFLDATTYFCLIARDEDKKQGANFIKDVAAIYREENLAFEIDELGGVHPLVDGAFGSARNSTMSSLSGERHEATVAKFSLIDTALARQPPDYISAVRSLFDALENLFKLMFKDKSVTRLGSGEAEKCISPVLEALYQSNNTVLGISRMQLNAFKNWTNLAHNIRHAEGSETPSQPPEEVALLILSEGMSFLRWLAQLDARMRAPQS